MRYGQKACLLALMILCCVRVPIERKVGGDDYTELPGRPSLEGASGNVLKNNNWRYDTDNITHRELGVLYKYRTIIVYPMDFIARTRVLCTHDYQVGIEACKELLLHGPYQFDYRFPWDVNG